MVVSLFDANFYRAANADLASFNDTQALAHFQSFGLNEGRRFNALVDLGFYRASNSDLASFNNQQLYEHLSNFGVTEGRKFSAFFDFDFYRGNNGDLRSFSNEQLFQHANDFGVNEGRRLSAFADLNYYRANNSDLNSFNNKQLLNHLQAFGLNEGRSFSQFINLNFYKTYNGDLASFDNKQLLNHLASFGINEGRRFNPLIDLTFYRSANSDLAAVGFNNQQLFNHLQTFGVGEGRRFSVSFDGNYYRNSYSDLAAAGFNSFQLFEHFQNFGLTEGRASSQSFNVTYYLGNNADLTTAGLNNIAALQHFEIFGFREGRVGEAPISLAANRSDNTLSTAPNLDVLSYNRTFSNQSVGSGDTDDFYRFLLADRSNLTIGLSGVTSNAVVQVVQDINNNGLFEDDEVLFGRIVAGGNNASASFDIGALAGGTYFVRIAPDSATTSTNYNLSMTADLVPPSVPLFPGISPDNPFILGTLSNGTVSLRDVVSRTARDDYYQFTITNPTELNLSLTGLRGDADVQIFQGNANAQSSPIYGSYNRSNTPESIRTFLEPGTYTIQVFSNDGSTNNYNLRLTTSASTPIEPNNTLGTAFNFGNLTGNSLTLRQVVGATDAEDVYKFSLNRTSQVNLNFNASTVGTTIGAKLDLIYDSNSNGAIDEGDRVFANLSPGQITPTLGAGTYFVRVFTDVTPTTTDSNYILNLSATATAAPTSPTDPGNSRDAAANIGTLSATTRFFNDFVGSADRQDYYRFSLSGKSNLELTLNQLNDNAYLELFSESGDILARSYASDTETTRFGSISASNLDAGNYFARVFTSSTAANTNYRLGLQAVRTL